MYFGFINLLIDFTLIGTQVTFLAGAISYARWRNGKIIILAQSQI